MTSANASIRPLGGGSGQPPDSRPRVLYADLDGTLVGPGGSLFAAGDPSPSIRAAEAVRSLHEAGVELVLVSGRGRPGLFEPSRILGADAFIAELGGLLVERISTEEIVVPNFGAFEGTGSPYEAMARTGAAAFLLERFEGFLEPFRRFNLPSARVASMLFRGYVDPAEATEALGSAGYGWLAVHDNGRVHGGSPALRVTTPHAIHLTPKGVDKPSAIALHRARHGIEREHAAAVGDSRSDLAMASEVGTAFLVANGVAGDIEDAPANAWVTASVHGDGFAEAVACLLG
ncbi:MAG: HAD hydrolase family protein [Actinomycetota bacterium]